MANKMKVIPDARSGGANTTPGGPALEEVLTRIAAIRGVGEKTVERLRGSGLTAAQMTSTAAIVDAGAGIGPAMAARISEALTGSAAAETVASPPHDQPPVQLQALSPHEKWGDRDNTMMVRLRRDLHAQLELNAAGLGGTIQKYVNTAVIALLTRQRDAIEGEGLWRLPDGWDHR
jgi:hypothetical protein